MLSSPASKSSGPFKTLLGRMRSGSRAARPLDTAALDEHPILTDPEPPTPRALPDAVPQPYSSRALRPVVLGQPVLPIEPSFSSDEYDDSDEPEDEDEAYEAADGRTLGLDAVAAPSSPPPPMMPNSRFVPPHLSSDADDESDSEGGDDSLAFTFSRGRAERRS